MIKTAHASSREAAVLQMKKVRKMRSKRKLEDAKKRADMSEEEYVALTNKRYEKSLREQVQTAIWDYEHRQYAIGRYAKLRQLLEARRLEIATDTPELQKIEAILNEIK